MRLGQTSIVYVISKITASAIGFFATIYFTRTLGEEIYGFYALVLALVSWLGLVKSVGFGKAIIKRMSEDEEPDAYLAAGMLIKGVLTVIVAILVFVFGDLVNAYIGRPVAEFVVLLLVVSIFSELVNSALKGTHRVHVYAPLSTLKEAARSILMVFLVFVGWELTGMLVGHALGTAVMAAIGLWIVRPNLALPEWRHVVGLFDFAKYSWVGSMRGKTFNDMDILILGLFVPAGLTGIYAIAYSLSKFLEIFGKGIQNALFPEISRLSTRNDMEMVSTLTTDALSFTGLFLLPGIVGAAILGDRLLLVYGPGFEIGHWILTILLVGLAVYTYTQQLLNTLNAVDRPDLAFRANAVFIVVNIALNVVLIWQLGWIGAAIATAISAMVGFVFAFHYTQTLISFNLPTGEIARQWVAALLMGLFVYTARELGEANWQWVNDYNAVFVVSLVGLGAAIYFVTLLVISTQFRQTVDRNLPIDIPFVST